MEKLVRTILQHIRTIVSLILRKITKKNYIDDGNSLLHVACLNGDVEVVRHLIELGTDVNLRNNKSETAMNFVFDCRTTFPLVKSHILEMLLNSREMVLWKDDDGRTALYVAVSTGNVDMVRHLVDQKTDVNEKDKSEGWTALHYAAFNIFSEDPAMFEVLLSANADVNATSNTGDTPLHILAQYSPRVNSSLFKIVQVFLKYGAIVHARNDYDQTPMDYAICHSNLKAVKALVLCGGVDVNSQFTPPPYWPLENDATILHGAAIGLNLPIIKFLLKNGANVNALDAFNLSPLLYMVNEIAGIPIIGSPNWINDKIKCLEYFLEWDPDVNIITADGFNALTFSWFELPDILWRRLLEHFAKLHVSRRSIHPNLLETINEDPKLKDYFKKCVKELNFSKKTKLCSNSWVTFFNLLVDDKKKLARYAGNKDLCLKIIKTEIVENFPIYGVIVQQRFLEAFLNRFILEESAKVLSDQLPICVDPSHRVVIKIISFLGWKDLKKLCDIKPH